MTRLASVGPVAKIGGWSKALAGQMRPHALIDHSAFDFFASLPNAAALMRLPALAGVEEPIPQVNRRVDNPALPRGPRPTFVNAFACTRLRTLLWVG